MRDKNRIREFLKEIADLWEKEPFTDWRFGQFMCNFIGWVYQVKQRDAFFLEEDQFIQYLKEYIEEVNNGKSYF